MEENKEKKSKKKVIIVVALLLCIITGVSYAYLGYFAGEGANAIINVSTVQPNDLSFSVDHDLSMTLNQFNFTTEDGNKENTAIGTASLKANNTDKTAESTYNVYFSILLNEFIYTTEEEKPEIILTITDPAGGAITSLPGLNYVTVGDVSGFDVTEVRSGLLHIAQDYPIESHSSKTATKQDWTFSLNFINLETNQKANAGKTFNAKIVLLEDEYVQTFADYIISTYKTDDLLFLHDRRLMNGADDNSYRYAGANPNNYVCFGSTASTCPENNLYRIIGVFDNQVKLIKNASIGNYYWGGSSSNTSNVWANSTLNTGTLNGTYLNGLGETWSDKITEHTWHVGGFTWAQGVEEENGVKSNAKKAYDYEVGTNAINVTYNAEVGLMYVSDYYYGAAPMYWAFPGYDASDATRDYRAAKESNWLYIGIDEWTITSYSNGSMVFCSRPAGNIGGRNAPTSNVIRPTFYLNSSVTMTGGNGSIGNPYRIG